jgi:protein SCO1/2
MERREENVALTGLVALFTVTAATWALAFWPVQESAGWVARTRYVCFGVSSNGLPDGGGWIALIGGPLGMLGMLAAGWSRGLRMLFRHARTSRVIAASLSTLALGSLMLVAGAISRVAQARDANAALAAIDAPAAAEYPRLDRPAPALALFAQDGHARALTDLRGRPVLVTFGYAHCETVCPLTVQRVLTAQRQLNASGSQIAVLIVTLDPWRDTPARLASMASSWQLPDQDAWVLSGAVDSVQSVLDAWEVPRTRDERTGDLTHPGLVYVIDAEGRIAFATNAASAETLADLVRRAAAPTN